MKGKLYILDGIDGSGKSSLAKSLAKKFKGVYLSEPDKTSRLGKKIRKMILEEKIDALSELFLFLISRRQIYKNIAKFLAKGKIVFLDRSFPSTLAYQLEAQNLKKFIDEKTYLKIDRLTRFKLNPDLIFILDVDVKTALRRIKRKKTKFEKEKLLVAVRKAFLKLAKKHKWLVVDAKRPFEEVKDFIFSKIKENLEK